MLNQEDWIMKIAKRSFFTPALTLLLCAAMICGLAPTRVFAQGATATNVSTYEQLEAAIERGDALIYLANDIELRTGHTGSFWLTVNSPLTIRGDYQIAVRNNEHQRSFSFHVRAGAHLILDGPTLIGSINVREDGAATLQRGAIHRNATQNTPGVTVASGGSFAMEGGSIIATGPSESWNDFGVIVRPNASFVMNGGTISDFGAGVGIDVSNNLALRFTMNGGAITGNIAGIRVGSGSSLDRDRYHLGGVIPFVINGGSISGNGIEVSGFDMASPTATPQPTPTPTEPVSPAEPPNLISASSWARDDIIRAFDLGLVPVTMQWAYTQAATRVEFAALAVALYERLSGEITGRVQFEDTNDVNVQKMAYLGVVTGVGNNRFNPAGQITREQAAVMLSRLADAIGRPFPPSAPTFADSANLSSWAVEGVGQMQASGIMGGVGNNRFDPRGAYTREQSIITILRLYDFLD